MTSPEEKPEDENFKSFWSGFRMGFSICLWISFILASIFTTLTFHWRADAIRYGNGQYNPQTGIFQWIDHNDGKK